MQLTNSATTNRTQPESTALAFPALVTSLGGKGPGEFGAWNETSFLLYHWLLSEGLCFLPSGAVFRTQRHRVGCWWYLPGPNCTVVLREAQDSLQQVPAMTPEQRVPGN